MARWVCRARRAHSRPRWTSSGPSPEAAVSSAGPVSRGNATRPALQSQTARPNTPASSPGRPRLRGTTERSPARRMRRRSVAAARSRSGSTVPSGVRRIGSGSGPTTSPRQPLCRARRRSARSSAAASACTTHGRLTLASWRQSRRAYVGMVPKRCPSSSTTSVARPFPSSLATWPGGLSSPAGPTSETRPPLPMGASYGAGAALARPPLTRRAPTWSGSRPAPKARRGRPAAHAEVPCGVEDLLGRRRGIRLDPVHLAPPALGERPAGERRPRVVLEGERGTDDLGHPRILRRQRRRDAVEASLDVVDRLARRCAALHVGEAGECRVALEERAAGQQPVAVSVGQRLRLGGEPPALILEGMGELVRDEQLADQVAAGEQREEPHAEPAHAERLGREDELLRARVVEGGDLSAVELLEHRSQRDARGQEPQTLVDHRDAVEVVPRVREVDVAADPGGDVVGPERHGRDGTEEVEAPDGGKVVHHCGERARVDLPLVHEPAADTAGGERDGEQRGGTAHGPESSVITAGYPRRLTISPRATATTRRG